MCCESSSTSVAIFQKYLMNSIYCFIIMSAFLLSENLIKRKSSASLALGMSVLMSNERLTHVLRSAVWFKCKFPHSYTL